MVLAESVFAGRAKDVRALVESGWELWRRHGKREVVDIRRRAAGRNGSRPGQTSERAARGARGSQARRWRARRFWRSERSLARRAGPRPGRASSGRRTATATLARGRWLVQPPADGLLYVALSTGRRGRGREPRHRRRGRWRGSRSCRFPEALAALPDGGALMTCRFAPGLWRVERARDGWRVRARRPRRRRRARAASRSGPRQGRLRGVGGPPGDRRRRAFGRAGAEDRDRALTAGAAGRPGGRVPGANDAAAAGQ